MSAEAHAVMSRLDTLAGELDTRSGELAEVDRKLAPVEDAYDDFYEAFIAGMFEADDGKRLPGEDVRRALCHQRLREEKPELLGRYRDLSRARRRLEKRLAAVKAAVDAQRSVLSALKAEMEATR